MRPSCGAGRVRSASLLGARWQDVSKPPAWSRRCCQKKGGPTVKGPPGEVVLWLLGRKEAARVEVVA